MKARSTLKVFVAQALLGACVPGALLMSACSDDAVTKPVEARAQLVIESPTEGFVTAEVDLELRFKVQDAAASGYVVYVGETPIARQEEPLAIGAVVKLPLSLDAGVHVIRVELLDAKGIADSASVTVVRVDERPELEVLAPSNGLVSESRQVNVRFVVKQAEATGYRILLGEAELASSERTLAVDEEVTEAVSLASGVNTLRIVLLDAAGEAASVERVVIVNESQAPRAQLEVQSPVNASTTYRETVEVVFVVRGVSASGYRITVNDTTSEVARNLVADELVRESITLVPGLNTVTVALFDAEGEASRQSMVLSYEVLEAPHVVIETPADNAMVFGQNVVIGGEVLGPRALEAVFVKVGDANEVAALVEGNRFNAEVALEVGTQVVRVRAIDVEGREGEATVSISREEDSVGPVVGLHFPRNNQAVKTLQALVRGQVSDNDAVASVAIVIGQTRIPATLSENGNFEALVPLAAGSNAIVVEATDLSGNTTEVPSTIYSGERLSGGGSHGGAVRNGVLYTWGRNNLGQTGLGFTSHESRSTWCSRGLSGVAASICGLTTYTSVFNMCDTHNAGNQTERDACRARLQANRAEVCADMGSQAPSNCLSGASVNMITQCDNVYGIRSQAAVACQSKFVCDSLYLDGESAEAQACEGVLASVPTTYPAPPPPYSAQKVNQFVIGEDTVTAANLGATFQSISFNQNASAAIDSLGRLWTWGDNAGGQGCLGDEETRDMPHLVPAFGAAGTKVVGISRGYDQLMILLSDGSVWGCGANDLGQIGDGAVGGNRMVPTRTQGLPSNIVQVMSSSKNAYALTADGQVYAWGRNQYGNLGNGQSTTSSVGHAVPQLVPGIEGALSLANGRDHVLAAMTDGSIMAWGLNASGQVAPSGNANQLAPIAVPEVKGAMAVYANGNQSFYLDVDGRLWGWGQNGSTANLGIPEEANQPLPTVPVFGLDQLLDVGIGALHGFGMRGEHVFAWGWSFHGSLGGGDATIHTWGYRTPIQVRFAN